MMENETFRRCYQQALRYLNRRALSTQELKKKLFQYNQELDETFINSVLQRLQDMHLLNDEYLAEHRAQQLQQKGHSKKFLKQRLAQQGLTILKEQEESEEFQPLVSDEEVLERFLREKKKKLLDTYCEQLKEKDPEQLMKTQHKIFQAVLMKGHDYATAKRVLQKLLVVNNQSPS